jgi:hypothetical protein
MTAAAATKPRFWARVRSWLGAVDAGYAEHGGRPAGINPTPIDQRWTRDDAAQLIDFAEQQAALNAQEDIFQPIGRHHVKPGQLSTYEQSQRTRVDRELICQQATARLDGVA